MKKINPKLFVVLGSSIALIGVILFTFLLSMALHVTEQTNIDINEESLNSRYITESVAILESDKEEVEYTEGEVSLEKQGILKLEESRKILKVSGTLTSNQISNLEEKYSISFTEDTSKNGIYVVTVSDSSNIEELQEELNASVETDIPVKMSADIIDWGVARIGADKVWGIGSGVGIKIAIIDTGVQKDHPDLVSNLLQGYDFVNNDIDATDDNGHGTHVAGIASATLNQAGVVGVGNTAKILPVKVLNNQGYGYLSDVAKGIYFATDNGARVINLSLGSPSDSPTLRDAVNYAASKGVLVVAAAGNDGGAPCSYPAAYSNAICVVATDSKNMLASFSNIGGELSAPGVSNYSTYLGSSYRYLSGTSMASPHVAGSAALLMSICTTCSTTEIRNLLRDTAIDLGETGKDILFGYGLVDLTSAVEVLKPTEEIPVEEQPDQTEETAPTKPTPTSKSKDPKRVSQVMLIVEPTITKGKKYIPTTVSDITVKYTLDPITDSTDLSKVVLYVDNKEISSSTTQKGEFTATNDLFNHSQHWIKVTGFFKDGTQSSAQLVVDMTYLQSLQKASTRSTTKSVLGVSFSIFDWLKIF